MYYAQISMYISVRIVHYLLCRCAMIKYDKAFALMKQKGLTTYKIRQDKIVGENTLTSMRRNQFINLKAIDSLCKTLDCQPGDLMEYVTDTTD